MRATVQRDPILEREKLTGAKCRWRGLLPTLREERGSVLIETALGFMLIMAMVLGIMECCMMAYTYGVLEESARQGVRYAAIHGSDSTNCSGPSTGCADSTAANVVGTVTTYASSFAGNVGGMSVTVTYPDGASTANSRVQVAIAYTYQPYFKYPGTPPILKVSSAGRIIY